MINKIVFICALLVSVNVFSTVNISKKQSTFNVSASILTGLENPELNDSNSVKLGYFNGAQWLQLDIKNTEPDHLDRVLFLDSINGRIEVYYNQIKVVPDAVFGSSIPQIQQEIKSRFSSLVLKLKPYEERKIYFKITSRHNFNTRFYISSVEDFNEFEKDKDLFFFIYIGAILSLVFYNLIIYVYLKDPNYLRFCIFSFSFLMTLSTIKGYADCIYHESTISYSHYLMFFSSLTLFFATRFAYYFLEVYKIKQIHKTLFNAVSIASCVFALISFSPLEDLFPLFFGVGIDILIFVAELYYIVFAILCYKQIHSAKFYLLSWSIVLVALVFWFGSTFGFFPTNFWTSNSLLLANIGQMLTLSLALSYRIHTLQQEKVIAQQKAIGKDRYQRLLRVLFHDVSNSLTVIYANTQRLIKMSQNADEDKIQTQQKILFATENIKGILSQIKQQELKDETNNKSVELSSFEILPILEKSKLIFESDLSRKNIELVLQIPEKIVLNEDPVIFLNNIACNIISNAIKFSYPDTKIIIKAYKQDSKTYIEFQDSGVGIDNDLIQSIYFSDQVVSSNGTQQEKGYGFGTSIIRDYVALFGGTIEVESVSEKVNTLKHGTLIRLVF